MTEWPIVLLGALLAGCVTPARPIVANDRVLEGTTDAGITWRLHRDESKTQRLAVWLHPTGETSAEKIEPLAPLLAKYGYALLVPLQRKGGWSGEEATAVFNGLVPTLPVDTHEPLLIGFSAGAQMALLLWQKHPDAFGGVVLIGAAPRLDALPANAESTAVLALVGEKEPIVEEWLRAVEPWRKAGIPLTLKIVEGRGHEFLLTPAELPLFEQWLQAVQESSTTPPSGG